MKKIILILLLLSSNFMFGQNFNTAKEYFTVSTSIDPGASIKDGLLDTVIEIEYVGFIYAKAGVEYFPALDPSYFDWHGAIGINLFLDKFKTFRTYGGIRLGRIYRENKSRGELFGFEIGIDYNISKHIFLGLRTTYDYRNDGVHLGWDSFWRQSGYIRLGYKWNYKN